MLDDTDKSLGFWTEHLDALRRMVEDNKSPKEAARALGVTTNAVIGKAKRAGLHFKVRSKMDPRPKKVKQPQATLAGLRKMKAEGQIEAAPPDAPKIEPDEEFWGDITIVEPKLRPPGPPAPLPEPPPRSWDFPPHSRCHFPLGDLHQPGFRFCGEPVGLVGAPYCAEHRQLAYHRTVLPADTVRRRRTS